MADLTITFTLTQAKDCKSIALVDTTGAYDADDNPGGYGLPGYNSPRDISDIQGCWIRVTLPKEDTFYSTIGLNSSDAQAIAGGTIYYITNALFGGLSTESLPDGVYRVDYIPIFNGNSADIYSSTLDDNFITFSSGDSGDFPAATNFQDSETGTIYTVSTYDTDSVTFEEDLPALANNMEDSYIGYGATVYIGCKCQINNCLHQKVAALATASDCGCSGCGSDSVCEKMALFFAIQTNMDLERYDDAQSIIDSLTNYCSGDDCGCS